ncbi:hypothetical protein Tter_0825 [Thermobaculum terrenum ATCC BAA-798]|uniref:Response regulator receiver protein n=1 Tax=Thermobaculum terrenum (strain ATCC BAA-798 / CCMEE 7001 / YNP1) TaxID=525904 RepID=D1CFN6_THET1|nr:hypothetical protein [Thermobaculum terrenum]ACZ41742.1 hypothetical protein Tter_0825 [Thermobaculum terrenum ATCC BAA-798]
MTKPKIMIASSTEQLAISLSFRLHAKDVSCDLAMDSSEASELLSKNQYSAVIIDDEILGGSADVFSTAMKLPRVITIVLMPGEPIAIRQENGISRFYTCGKPQTETEVVTLAEAIYKFVQRSMLNKSNIPSISQRINKWAEYLRRWERIFLGKPQGLD